MVDLTRHPGKDGNLVVRARLLDLVPGRSGEAYRTWLTERGEAFRSGIEIATSIGCSPAKCEVRKVMRAPTVSPICLARRCARRLQASRIR